MNNECLFDPRIQHGQGKIVKTLLTEAGCHYPIIAHHAYSDRKSLRSAPVRNGMYVRGSNPLQRSTLVLAKPPWTPEYVTTTKQYYGGSKNLLPVEHPPLSRSMHVSQIRFGNPQEGFDWNTSYYKTYPRKEIIPANRLHLTSLVNRIDQTEGAAMKNVVQPTPGPSNYWSQYNRIHNKLGYLLGPGVERGFPIREKYNVITGETGGAAWQPDNRRVSGNRVLHSARNLASTPVIS